MRKSVLISLLLLLATTAMAQRDWQLFEEKENWVTTDNAAGLVALPDSGITKIDVAYGHSKGDFRTTDIGSHVNEWGTEGKTYQRLSPSVVLYGEAKYASARHSSSLGTLLNGLEVLQPIDADDSDDGIEAHKNQSDLEMIGKVGWNVYKQFSVGASVNAMRGVTKKYTADEPRNTYGGIETMVSMRQRFTDCFSLGSSFLYYGNTEKLGSRSMTDTPMTNNSFGIATQGEIKGGQVIPFEFFFTFNYMRRNGHYGQDSQSTAYYADFSGNSRK